MGGGAVAGGVTSGVAGLLVLRPGEMPAGLDEGYGYEKACADLGVGEPPVEGVVGVGALRPEGGRVGPRAAVDGDADPEGDRRDVGALGRRCPVRSARIANLLHVAEGWVHPGDLRLNPEYAALGWEGVSAMAIRHPPPDASAGEHRPVRRHALPGQRGASTVGCESCAWSQRVDAAERLAMGDAWPGTDSIACDLVFTFADGALIPSDDPDAADRWRPLPQPSPCLSWSQNGRKRL
jgi:hypothetical protein